MLLWGDAVRAWWCERDEEEEAGREKGPKAEAKKDGLARDAVGVGKMKNATAWRREEQVAGDETTAEWRTGEAI